MYQGRVHIVGIQLGNRQHPGLVHDDGVALRVPFAGRVAGNAGRKLLEGLFPCHGAGHHICRRAVSVQIGFINAFGFLVPMGHEPFPDHQGRIGRQFRFRGADRGIHALDLHHFHFHGTAFFQIGFRHRVQNAFAPAVPFSVMLFHIFYFAVFAHKEAVHPVMLGILHAAVMDAAACYDDYITVFTDIKIVINRFFQSAVTEYNRNMYAFLFRTRFDADIDAAHIRLGNNVNISRRVPRRQLAVGPYIIRAGRHRMEIRNLRQESFLNCINHSSHLPVSGSRIRQLRHLSPTVPEEFLPGGRAL